MKHIIILNGAPESGKGVFVSFFNGATTVKLSIIDTTKDLAVALFGWNRVKDAAGRRLLSDLYEAAMAYNSAPLQDIARKAVATTVDRVLIDVRIPDAISRLNLIFKTMGIKCTTVLIEREAAKLAAIKDKLPADCLTHEYNYDIIIGNNGSVKVFEEAVKTTGLLD